MQRAAVLDDVLDILQRAGWKHVHVANRCFDVLSKGEDRSVVLKVHANVDSATREQSEEMKQAAMYLSSAPLFVGKRNSRGELKRQVIYERYGIPTINPETLESYLELQEQTPVVNKKGGHYVSLDGDKIEEKRREQGYSLNALAKEVGVSPQTIRKYRDNGMATVEKAQKLEQALGDVVNEINILQNDVRVSISSDGDRVVQHLGRIGLEAAAFSTAPFDIGARDEADRFVGKKEPEKMDAGLLDLLIMIERWAGSTPFLIGDTTTTYGSIPTISDSDLAETTDKDDLKTRLSA